MKPRWQKPDDLSAGALKVWKNQAPGLVAAGRLTPETAENFKMLCRILSLAAAAAQAIEADGVTVQAGSGGKKSNPAAAVLFQAQRDAAKLLRDFGLT